MGSCVHFRERGEKVCNCVEPCRMPDCRGSLLKESWDGFTQVCDHCGAVYDLKGKFLGESRG